MSRFEIEKDWRVSVISLSFILAFVVGLDFYSSKIVGFFKGVPFYVFVFLAVFSLACAWVLSKIY